MPNTSASGGYLNQTSGPLEGAAFNHFLHDFIAAVTGLAATSVRPLWQPNPPPIPNIDTNWVAFGITNVVGDYDGYHKHINETITPPVAAHAEIVTHEQLDVQCSFYGPDAIDYINRLRDGTKLAQNREQLFLNGVAIFGFSGAIHAPELVNDRYFNRADTVMTLRREIKRSYAVLDFVAANGAISANRETGTLTEPWSA